MEFGGGPSWIVLPIQIFFLDLLLCADNALVIALACRALRPDDARRAIVLGTAGAVAVRLAMTIVASLLLTAPYIKLAAALVLIVTAVNVTAQDMRGLAAVAPKSGASAPATRRALWSIALAIVMVDAAMGLDNVVAIAAIARGNPWLLGAGVLFTIPTLAYGSLMLAALVRRYPELATVGGGLLGWIGGEMAISDPAIAGWAAAQAPALALIAPLLGAAFVVLEARFVGRGVPSEAPARTPVSASLRKIVDRAPAARIDLPIENRTPRRRARRVTAIFGRFSTLLAKAKPQKHRIVIACSMALSFGMIAYVRYLDGLLSR